MYLLSSLTLHEDPEHVLEDGEGGPEDEDGEQEGADGVCYLIFRLRIWRRGGSSHGEEEPYHILPSDATKPSTALAVQRSRKPRH